MTDDVKLFTALNYVDPDLIAGAEAYRPRARRWVKWTALAACLALIVSLGALLAAPPPSAAPPSEGPGSSGAMMPMPSSGAGPYDGPILPLNVSDSAGISAERELTLDFTNFAASDWPRRISVTDRYTLTNTRDRDVTLTAWYPFVGSFSAPDMPGIWVDGGTAETVLRTGPYAGGFVTADRPLLSEPLVYGEYEKLLSDGSYFSAALEDVPNIDTPTTVYELRGVDFDRSRHFAVLNADIDYDRARTTVFLWGFNSDGFSVEQEQDRHYFGITWPDDISRYIIAVGDDIDGLALQGYKDAKLAPGEEFQVTTDLRKYETTLGGILDRLAEGFAEDSLGADLPGRLDPSMDPGGYIREVRRGFLTYSRLGSDPSPRYEGEQLERLLNDTMTERRVMYLEFALTIPAGGKVTVEAQQSKSGSAAFNADVGRAVSRYDAASTLGSDLRFTSQRAVITGSEALDIIENTFPPSGQLTGGVYTIRAAIY